MWPRVSGSRPLIPSKVNRWVRLWSSLSQSKVKVIQMVKTVEEVYGVGAMRGFDPVKAAEAREHWRPADLSALGDPDKVHPYYLEKAEEVRQRFQFDVDADMRWLALWAEHWDELPKGQRIAIADSTGTIWGFAVPALEPRAVEVVARETYDRLHLGDSGEGSPLDFALARIERRVCRPVVVVRDWLFHGPSNHGKGVRS